MLTGAARSCWPRSSSPSRCPPGSRPAAPRRKQSRRQQRSSSTRMPTTMSTSSFLLNLRPLCSGSSAGDSGAGDGDAVQGVEADYAQRAVKCGGIAPPRRGRGTRRAATRTGSHRTPRTASPEGRGRRVQRCHHGTRVAGDGGGRRADDDAAPMAVRAAAVRVRRSSSHSPTPRSAPRTTSDCGAPPRARPAPGWWRWCPWWIGAVGHGVALATPWRPPSARRDPYPRRHDDQQPGTRRRTRRRGTASATTVAGAAPRAEVHGEVKRRSGARRRERGEARRPRAGSV